MEKMNAQFSLGVFHVAKAPCTAKSGRENTDKRFLMRCVRVSVFRECGLFEV